MNQFECANAEKSEKAKDRMKKYIKEENEKLVPIILLFYSVIAESFFRVCETYFLVVTIIVLPIFQSSVRSCNLLS